MRSIRVMWLGVVLGSAMALGACDDGPGNSHSCTAALGKLTDCDISDTAIQQVGLCVDSDDSDGCVAACINSASCTDIKSYYAGSQMNDFGECLSKCNQ